MARHSLWYLAQSAFPGPRHPLLLNTHKVNQHKCNDAIEFEFWCERLNFGVKEGYNIICLCHKKTKKEFDELSENQHEEVEGPSNTSSRGTSGASPLSLRTQPAAMNSPQAYIIQAEVY